MPYRRLPNTDAARLRALETALNKSIAVHHTELAFSQKTLLKLKSFLTSYKLALTLNKEHTAQLKKLSDQTANNNRSLRLYFSHFVQVLNMAIIRGEYKPQIRTYYGFDEKATNLPDVVTDAMLVQWTKKIIEGEELRTREGGVPMSNPRIAIVKIKYDLFLRSAQSLKISQQSTKNAQLKIAEMKSMADAIILLMWNEIEAGCNGTSAEERRQQAEEYGVKYVFRPGER